MKKNVWLLLLLVSALGCKARSEKNDSQILEDTVLGTYPVDLTTYSTGGAFNTTEVAAIRLYTQEGKIPALGGNFYTVVNKALRDNDQSVLRSQAANIMNIASGANKLRSGACTTRRFVDLPYSVSVKLSTAGERYVDKAFFSSTLLANPPAAFANRPEVIITESPQCPVIESYSLIPGEREVLFPPGTEFEVTRSSQVVRVGQRNYSAYYLKEAKSGQKVQALNVGLGNQKADEDNANEQYDASKFQSRTYTGRDKTGKKRSVTFTNSSSATYTGAAGTPTSASWSITGNKIELVTSNTNSHLWYRISTEDKICFIGESQSGAATASCLVFDEDGDGEAGNVKLPDPVDVAQQGLEAAVGVTFKDFFDTNFAGAGLHLNFQKNKVARYYQDGQPVWSNATWLFYDNPARIQLTYPNNSVWWLHVVDANKICFAGTPNYTGKKGGCYTK